MATKKRDTLDDHGLQMDVIDYICDGCGRVEIGRELPEGTYRKPRHWFQRGDDDGEMHACSYSCCEYATEKRGMPRQSIITNAMLGIRD